MRRGYDSERIEPIRPKRIRKLSINREPFFSAILGLLEDGEKVSRDNAKEIHVALGGSSDTSKHYLISGQMLANNFGIRVREERFGTKRYYSLE